MLSGLVLTLSVYAQKDIKTRDIKEMYAMHFNAKPPMDISGYAWAMLGYQWICVGHARISVDMRGPCSDISGYAWAMLDDFLSAIEALASKCPIEIYLIFDAHQNPRKMETSEEREALTEKAAEDLDSYIGSRDAYN